MPPEGTGEVALIGETSVDGDARERRNAQDELAARPLQAKRARVLGHGHAVLAPKRAGDVGRGPADGGGELGERRVPRDSFIQQVASRA